MRTVVTQRRNFPAKIFPTGPCVRNVLAEDSGEANHAGNFLLASMKVFKTAAFVYVAGPPRYLLYSRSFNAGGYYKVVITVLIWTTSHSELTWRVAHDTTMITANRHDGPH